MGKGPLGKCKLCQKEKELSFSHIIPEFIYSPVYDEKHRAIMIPSGKERFPQKGVREYLLCSGCDGFLSKFETYSAPIIKAIQNLNIDQFGNQYIIRDIQYSEFKLFQLSLLWRASTASVGMFRNVNIGAHEDIIRGMLISQKPGNPDEYGCIMFVLEDTKYLHQIIWSPVTDQIDGCTCYRFLTGRIFWYFFPEAYPRYAGSFFLSPDGILRVVKAPWSEEIVIQRLAGLIASKNPHLGVNGG